MNASIGGTSRDELFADVYADNFDSLVRLASLLVDSAAAGEDIVQDSFAKLFVRLETVTAPQAWLRTTVVNACRNERRRLGTARRYASRLAGQSTAIDPPVDELIASLRRLPNRQRAAVVLRYYADLPEAEIAAILGTRIGTVKSALHRARVRLQSEVTDEPDF